MGQSFSIQEPSPNYAAWEQAKAIIMAHSNQDELVEKAQSSYMLERAPMAPHCKDKVNFLESRGAHDEIWASGYNWLVWLLYRVN